MTRLHRAVDARKGPLIGAAVQSYNPIFVEIIAKLGYDVLWIEMEHCFITFAQAADLCRVAAGVGLLTMIRIPDSRRENVLKAAECAPDVIDLPMGNSRQEMAELVSYARYAPEGKRGFFGSSRAVDYSLSGNIAEVQRRVNSDLCLISQIETREAVDRVDELCGVAGIDGIFIGPGDLSASLGVPGQTGHPDVVKAAEKVIAVARDSGKLVAMACAPGTVARWHEKGVQVSFICGEASCIADGARAALAAARESE